LTTLYCTQCIFREMYISNVHSICIFTRATHSIARSLLRQRGWLAGCLTHAGIVSKWLNLSQTFSTIWYHHHSIFSHPALTYYSKSNLFIGAINTRGWENWRFPTEIAVYFGNGARQAYGYGTLISSRGCRIEWYHFR